MTEQLTLGEQLIERWARARNRPCLHHHDPYQPINEAASASDATAGGGQMSSTPSESPDKEQDT